MSSSLGCSTWKLSVNFRNSIPSSCNSMYPDLSVSNILNASVIAFLAVWATAESVISLYININEKLLSVWTSLHQYTLLLFPCSFYCKAALLFILFKLFLLSVILFSGLNILSRLFYFFYFLFIDFSVLSRPFTTQSIFFFEFVRGIFFVFFSLGSLIALFTGFSFVLNLIG